MERLSQNDLPGGRNGVANDLDLILSSQLDNYNHLSRDYSPPPAAPAASEDLNSLFFDPSSVSSTSSSSATLFDLDTPPSSTISTAEIINEEEDCQQESAAGSYLKTLLDSEEKKEVDAIELSKGAPKSFPTRPSNCIQHVIPFSLFTDDLLRRFPANLYAKRSLIMKYGEPKSNGPHMIRSKGDQQFYLTVNNVSVEDIPPLSNLVQNEIGKNSGQALLQPATTPVLMCQFCCKTYKQMAALKRHRKDKHGFISP